jgi:superfamily II DNA or RNA helicase
MKLREYQTEAIQNARRQFAAGNLRQVIYAPTGAGKTVIGIEIIKSALARGKRVAFIANRIGLVEQTSRRLNESGIRHGVIQGNNSHAIDRPVLVCSIQTVARRGLPPVDLLVIDEAHACAGSKDYRKLIFQYSATPILGLTATPFAKGMGKGYFELGDQPLFQTMVVASTIADLIELGFLVDVEIFAPSEPDLTGVRVQKNAFGEMDYSEKELAKAVDKPTLIGDIVSHWEKLANDKPTVCFATNIAHSQHIVETFNASGIPAEHMDCYTEEAERRAILGRVESGQTKVISNVGILCEGWDFPACEVMILARPTKSLIRWVQMVGRILRPYDGKTRGIVLDHSGSSAHLGYPTDDLPLNLDDGKPKVSQASKPEEKLPKKCPSCSYMKPVGIHACPKCGFAPERKSDVVNISGDLVAVKRKKAKREDKQAVYSELLAIMHKRGYKDGWVANNYRDYFGVWPVGMRYETKEPSPEILNWITSKMIRYAKGIKNAA